MEALVALFIMALASSVIVLTMPPRPSPIDAQSDKLENLAEIARQTALVKGVWAGLFLADDKIHIVTYRRGSWVAARGKPARLEGRVSLADNRAESDDEVPIAYFGPTGTAKPVRLLLDVERSERVLSISYDGELVWENSN